MDGVRYKDSYVHISNIGISFTAFGYNRF